MNLDLLRSERFWQLFLIGIVTGLQAAYPMDPRVTALATAVQVWFGGSVAIGTVDRVAKRFAGNVEQ